MAAGEGSSLSIGLIYCTVVSPVLASEARNSSSILKKCFKTVLFHSGCSSAFDNAATTQIYSAALTASMVVMGWWEGTELFVVQKCKRQLLKSFLRMNKDEYQEKGNVSAEQRHLDNL